MLLKSWAMPPASRPSDSTFWAWSSWFCGLARVLEGLALDRVAHRPKQAVRVDPALDEVVLRALLQGLDGQRLVVEAGQDDQWDVGRGGVGAPHAFEALGVGQAEVEQDDVDGMRSARYVSASLMHVDVRQLGVLRVVLAEHLPEQARVSRVVFDDEEKPPDGLARQALNVNHRASVGRGGIAISILCGHLPPLNGGCGRAGTRGYAASRSQPTLVPRAHTSMKTLRGREAGASGPTASAVRAEHIPRHTAVADAIVALPPGASPSRDPQRTMVVHRFRVTYVIPSVSDQHA